MGRKGGKQKGPVVASGHQSGITLREESSGRKQTKGGSHNVKSILKLEHLQKLAVWASGEASMPSLGAFFGRRLASCGEAMGIPPDPSLFPCERCESILHPGYNCTVRIEKNRKAKLRHRRKKPNISPQNNVIYKCHFCSHRNLKRGTPKGHMKEICPPKADPILQSEPANSMLRKSASLEKGAGNKVEANNMDEIASPAIASEIPVTDSPTTPLARTGATLLEGKRRKRNRSGSNKAADSESNSAAVGTEAVSTSSKRKRKSWTSLKEIAENTHDNSHKISNLTIPFFM